MFKVIAVEPAAVANSYRDFKYITEKFGIHEGRLIAAFPKKWKKLVYREAQVRLKGMLDLSRLEDRLRRLKDDVLYRSSRPGEGCEINWLEAAIAEHDREPFDAIIASTPSKVQIVVAADDLDADHACLHPNRQWHIKREAEAMARCCVPLLSGGRHIKLIDPHFDLGQTRFRRPFAAMLKYVLPGTTVDVYRGDGQGIDFIAQRFANALSEARPEGVRIRLFLLPQETLHNRFLLTEIGGLYFLTGLDDQGNGELNTDEVGVLEPAVWAVQWGKFCGDCPVGIWA